MKILNRRSWEQKEINGKSKEIIFASNHSLFQLPHSSHSKKYVEPTDIYTNNWTTGWGIALTYPKLSQIPPHTSDNPTPVGQSLTGA